MNHTILLSSFFSRKYQKRLSNY